MEAIKIKKQKNDQSMIELWNRYVSISENIKERSLSNEELSALRLRFERYFLVPTV